MAITLKLYNISNDPKDIPKTIPEDESATVISGSYRDEPDVIRPVIRVNGAFPGNVNYAYLSDTGRYYFIKEMTQVTKDITDLQLECDVLQSHYKKFRTAPIIAARSYSGFNTFIIDNKRQFYAYDDHEYKHMSFRKGGQDISITNPDTIVVMTVG